MLTEANLRSALESLGFEWESDSVLSTTVRGFRMAADFDQRLLIYPESDGLVVNERQTCNFSSNENFVVFECVHRLLSKGYLPRHLELEPRWQVGRGASGGRADVLVRDNQSKTLMIIECKTAGPEYEHEWRITLQGKGQLFSYAQQASETEFLTLYSSDFVDGQVRYFNRIVVHRDNEQHLIDNPTLKPFKEATTTEGRFEVWRDTYGSESTTKGIFEDSIEPYRVGKDKYTLSDLEPISETDRRKKYNDFATILRQHNVSGRENAFDKLVNLLLCKLVDEARNPDDLKFYWKGLAFDTEFELLDRLQQLYKEGMAQFLGEDITYINEEDVNTALRFVRKSPDATQRAVWDLFVRQKFFTNNDFSFIDVHNEDLFHQNAGVLLQILRMWQDVRLTHTGETSNQFLGDMFENFLDQGIKQSEGQFFTPIPLVRFIVDSLPLDSLVVDSPEPPRVLDYACGAGHFLTEYANQVGRILSKQKSDVHGIESHERRIFGIEKEYRLSKVAKVSAFMYGQPNINIVYGDALAHSQVSRSKIDNESFDVIVANPPYSVKGFLETLSKEDRDLYELTQTVDPKALDTNNRIEAFFIERAKQLLRPGAVAAIVLPSSVLSNNDRPTRRARDILLEYFDILAIVELGSGAFGSTGTTTSTLFLRRKQKRPETLDHLKSRIEDWFRSGPGKKEGDSEYEDSNVLRRYAERLRYDPEDYLAFSNGALSERLARTDTFEGYRAAFEREASTRKVRTSSRFRALDSEAQELDLLNGFVAYCQTIERDKLLAFALALEQVEPVLLVQGPSSTKAMKRFLGYSWSKAKGNEGIKIVRDAEGHHLTPLYDDSERSNPSKLNYYIAKNFEGTLTDLPESLGQFAMTARLENLLEFGEPSFDRSISMQPYDVSDQPTSIVPMRKLSSIASEIHRGASPRPIDDFLTEDADGIPWVKIGDARPGAKTIDGTEERITPRGAESSRRVAAGDLIVSNSMSAGRPYLMAIDGCIHDGWLSLEGIADDVDPDYLYYVLADEFVQKQFRQRQRGPVVKNLNIPRVKSVLIPVADAVDQARLVREATEIEAAIASVNAEILALNTSILVASTGTATVGQDRLGNVAENVVDAVTPNAHAPLQYVGLESIQSRTGVLIDADEDADGARSVKRAFQVGDVLYGKLRPRLNKVLLATTSGLCSTDLLVLRFSSPESACFYATYLRSDDFNRKALPTVTNTMPRTSWEKLQSIQVPLLDQQSLDAWLSSYRVFETETAALNRKLETLLKDRADVVRKYI
jgi:type I restriction-modification system DNA methylase subunit